MCGLKTYLSTSAFTEVGNDTLRQRRRLVSGVVGIYFDEGTYHTSSVTHTSAKPNVGEVRFTCREIRNNEAKLTPFLSSPQVKIVPSSGNRGWAPRGNRWNVDGELLDDRELTLTNIMHSMTIFGCPTSRVPATPTARTATSADPVHVGSRPSYGAYTTSCVE